MSFTHHFQPGDPLKPTLLVLHGTGGDEHSLVPIAQSVAPGSPILSLRGRIDENGMPRFFRRFAEGVFDYDNIREEADALADFLRREAPRIMAPHAEPRAPRPEPRIFAFGYSNGANMAWSTILRHPDVLAGGILLRPMETLDETADLTVKRFFVSSGRHDPIVPIESVEALTNRMQRCGAEVGMNWQETGHQLTREELALAADWLAQSLG